MDRSSASQSVSRLRSLVHELHTAGDIYFNRRIVTEKPEEDIVTTLALETAQNEKLTFTHFQIAVKPNK